jgi:hypothetical protein
MSATKARNMKSNKKDLPPKQREELLKTLKARFEKNMDRHQGSCMGAGTGKAGS